MNRTQAEALATILRRDCGMTDGKYGPVAAHTVGGNTDPEGSAVLATRGGDTLILANAAEVRRAWAGRELPAPLAAWVAENEDDDA